MAMMTLQIYEVDERNVQGSAGRWFIALWSCADKWMGVATSKRPRPSLTFFGSVHGSISRD
jgi:hypothetical protein